MEDGEQNNNEANEEGSSSSSSSSSPRRWTCEACGCNTNLESNRNCSICGTGNGSSLLRRAGYAGRGGAVFGRGFTVRRLANSDSMVDESWEHVMDGMDMAGEEETIAVLAMEVAGVTGRDAAGNRQRLMDAARSFSMNIEREMPDAEQMHRIATDNASLYQPKWINPSQIGGRMRSGNGIEVGEGTSQSVAHLPDGAAEGRAIRAMEPFPRSPPFASFSPQANGAEGANSSSDASSRRAFGFKVAFDNPNVEGGKNLGGGYLLGVCTTSFSSFGERNSLQQSPFFWGIDDSARKYEGTRYRSSRSSSGLSDSDIPPSQAARNADNVIFGARDVVTCVVDFETRTITFWRNETRLGTLVSNLPPRNGNLYPVAVPYNSGSSVAITGMDGDPLALLDSFSDTWHEAKSQKQEEQKKSLVDQEKRLIKKGAPSKELVQILEVIFQSYLPSDSMEVDLKDAQLQREDAAKLWYRCGMSLSHLSSTLGDREFIVFQDFLEVVKKVISEERGYGDQSDDSVCQVGDMVELVDGYERFGDSTNGPMRPLDRAQVIEIQKSDEREKRFVRIIYQGRRWWYQPQAVLPEKCSLIESPRAWFIKLILRAHGYDVATLKPLFGQDVKSTSWLVGDIVVPRRLKGKLSRTKEAITQTGNPMDAGVGRIVAESVVSPASIGVRGRESGTVIVECIDKIFSEATGFQDARPGPARRLETRRINVSKLRHSSVFHFAHAPQSPLPIAREAQEKKVQCSESKTPAALLAKIKDDIGKLRKADNSSADNLVRLCRRNPTFLLALIEAGLCDAILEAMDRIDDMIEKSLESEIVSRAVSSLGCLVTVVIEQLYKTGDSSDDSNYSEQATRNATSWTEKEEDNRQEQRGSSSTGIRASDVQSLSAAGRRRNMMLNLIARARDGRTSISMEDLLSDPDGGIGPIRADEIAMMFGGPNSSSSQSRVGGARTRLSARRDLTVSSLNSRSRSEEADSKGDKEVAELTAGAAGQSVLNDVLRGRRLSAKPLPVSLGRSTTLTTAKIRSLISNGLVADSLPWVEAILDLSPDPIGRFGDMETIHDITDEDGMTLLQLALHFGCSEDVLRHLVASGAAVGREDLVLAATMNQTQALKTLLQSSLYAHDLLDQTSYSKEVAAVIADAIDSQDKQREVMESAVADFFLLFTKRLAELCLKTRRDRPLKKDSCGRAIGGVLVGNVLLRALHKNQQKMTQTKAKSDKSGSGGPDEGDRSDHGRLKIDDALQATPRALLQAVPRSLLAKAVFSERLSTVTYMLMIEDFLCSKNVNDSAVGLSMLRQLLVDFPSFRDSTEVERFGFKELVGSHQAFASSRLSTLRSRCLNSSDNSTSGVVTCPKKHPALLHITRHSSFRCDMCGKGVDRGRVMHGCRECDWDACDRCTDRAESGIVKWSYIRDEATTCLLMMASYADRNIDAVEEAVLKPALQELSKSNGIAELNNVTMRLLQRDPEAVTDLARMLKEPGLVTIHQFLNLVLPALHTALFDDCLESSKADAETDRRSKKPRTLCNSRAEDDTLAQRDEEDSQMFGLHVLKSLGCDSQKPKSKAITEFFPDFVEAEDASDEMDLDDENDEQHDESSPSDEVENWKVECRRSPELLRRLHKVLSLFECASEPLHKKPKGKGGELQALTATLQLNIQPTSKVFQMAEVHIEPLTDVSDLELHALRIFARFDKAYTRFCRRLASDNCLIVERSGKGNESSNRWKIARVLSYDGDTGCHRIQYSSGLASCSDYGGRVFDMDFLHRKKQIQFNGPEATVVLLNRDYMVLTREKEYELRSKTRAAASQASNDRKASASVGKRVESDCRSDKWESFTIISSCRGESGQNIFTLVSDDGVVIPNVEASRVRGETASDSGGRSVESESSSSSYSPVSNEPRRFGALRRTWSALASIESMAPAELDITQSTSNDSVLDAKTMECDLNGEQATIRVQISGFQSPPQVKINSWHCSESGNEVRHDCEGKTVLALLVSLLKEDDIRVISASPRTLFFDMSCEEYQDPFLVQKISSKMKSAAHVSDRLAVTSPWLGSQSSVPRKNRKLLVNVGIGHPEFDEVCAQCMQILGLLGELNSLALDETACLDAVHFENTSLSRKLKEHLDDPLLVTGACLPEWCLSAPTYAPRLFSYKARKLLMERTAFGVSRSALRLQEAKVDVSRLRQRMASLRARAVELVSEAFSGGAEDPTALQLQADELYGMEEALASRVRQAFKSERWNERRLQVVKAAVHRHLLISDAMIVMEQYANDRSINRRRLEVRFEGESGFDAASGDEAGVTRGFYADVAEALLSLELVAGVSPVSPCDDSGKDDMKSPESLSLQAQGLFCRVPLWIPDIDASGQVIIPTPRACPASPIGVFPRPLGRFDPLLDNVLTQFRFMGRLFAAALRDGFMFPLPLSSSFLKLVQLCKLESCPPGATLLTSNDLPRPGFLGGDVFATESFICKALDFLDSMDPPLERAERERRYKEIATDKRFAHVALGKSYECSFEEYFEERRFVDPLDPSQGPEAAQLCPNGDTRAITIFNVREWVGLAKTFMLHDGIIEQARAFCDGVEDFFPSKYLRLFTPEELQKDVCGVGDDVDAWDEAAIRKLFKLDGGKGAEEALVAVAAIGGEGGAALSRRFGPSSPTIKFVVKGLLEASPKLRRQFLSFVTSVPIVTPGQIEVVPIVSPSGEFSPMQDPGCLPRANTCSRRLYLPHFESYESFKQVFWAVVSSESKFKGFYEWRGN